MSVLLFLAAQRHGAESGAVSVLIFQAVVPNRRPVSLQSLLLRGDHDWDPVSEPGIKMDREYRKLRVRQRRQSIRPSPPMLHSDDSIDINASFEYRVPAPRLRIDDRDLKGEGLFRCCPRKLSVECPASINSRRSRSAVLLIASDLHVSFPRVVAPERPGYP